MVHPQEPAVKHWKKGDKGEYRQSIDACEKLLFVMGRMTWPQGKDQWSITHITNFQSTSSQVTAYAVRKAWAHLRFELPALAARYDDAANEKVYIIPTKENNDLEKWLDESVLVHEDETDAEKLTDEDLPHDLITLHYLPRTSHFICRGSHWRIDSIGLNMVMDRFYSILTSGPGVDPASLAWGEEINHLSPSQENALESPVDVDEISQQFVQKRMTEYGQAKPGVGLTYTGNNETLPGNTRRIVMKLTQDSTAALVKACKDRGTTVSIVVHAAIVMANYAFATEGSKSEPYSQIVPQSVRPFLPPPFNNPSHAVNLYTTVHKVVVPPHLSFPQTLDTLHKQYKEDFFSPVFVPAMRLWMEQILAAMSITPPPGTPPPANIFVSSMGIMDKYFSGSYTGKNGQAIEVLEKGIKMLWLDRQVGMHLWTWRGELTVMGTYNDAYYDGVFTKKLLAYVKTSLENGLGIKLEEEGAKGVKGVKDAPVANGTVVNGVH